MSFKPVDRVLITLNVAGYQEYTGTIVYSAIIPFDTYLIRAPSRKNVNQWLAPDVLQLISRKQRART